MHAMFRSGLMATLTMSFVPATIVPDLSADGQSLTLRAASVAAQETKSAKRKSGGLAGSEGTIKRKIMFPADWQGGCKSSYQNYVKAGGHSAYAATIVDYFYGGTFVCANKLNAASQAEAEKRALADCEASRLSYQRQGNSMQITGKCMIYSSK